MTRIEEAVDVQPADDGGLADATATVLLAGFDDAAADRLATRFGAAAVRRVADPEEAAAALDGGGTAVLCLGAGLGGDAARHFLDATFARIEDARATAATATTAATVAAPAPRAVVLAGGDDLSRFQDLIDRDRLYYLSPRPPVTADVERVVRGALAAGRRPVADAGDLERGEAVRRVLETAGELAAESDLESLSTRAGAAVAALADAESGACLLWDAASDTLWERRPGSGEERRESAAAGIVSFVLRAGVVVAAERVGDDPRYDPEADNEQGPSDERFLAVPVPGVASSGAASSGAATSPSRAVLVARRDGGRPPFGARERADLELLAAQLAPLLERLELADPGDVAAGTVFRSEALADYVRTPGEEGRVLELSPRWIRHAYPLLLAVFLAAALFAVLGSIHEYAAGIAVVRLGDATEITATGTGTVTAVHVAAGERVAAGRLLVGLYDARESAELERLRREHEQALVARLRNPADVAVEQRLGTLREERRLAESRLEERSIRAPRAGVVGDLRVQPGQPLTPGQVVLTLEAAADDAAAAAPTMLALLPGRYRPQLAPGMPLRLELEGHRHVYQRLTVDEVGERVVGPAEARRFLGAGIGDAVPLEGPVVFVRARLPAATFESGGRSYRYHDGILGRAEVRVRSERILFVLLPGLRPLFERDDG